MIIDRDVIKVREEDILEKAVNSSLVEVSELDVDVPVGYEVYEFEAGVIYHPYPTVYVGDPCSDGLIEAAEAPYEGILRGIRTEGEVVARNEDEAREMAYKWVMDGQEFHAFGVNGGVETIEIKLENEKWHELGYLDKDDPDSWAYWSEKMDCEGEEDEDDEWDDWDDDENED